MGKGGRLGLGAPGVDLKGRRFGYLTVKNKVKVSYGKYKWLCLCDCGKEHLVNTYHLLNGDIVSCGCMHYKIGHGQTNTRLYHIWCTMKARCNRKSSAKYRRYGGRGIRLCNEWRCFENFYSWAMENGYDETLSINRIDNDGDYCPENCRWATVKQQANNTSRTKRITAFGQTHSVSEWSEITGIDAKLIYRRLYRGWSEEAALTIPKGKFAGGKGRGHRDVVITA